MKPGIGSYAFRWAIEAPEQALDAFGFLRKSAALGAEAVQICDNLPLEQMPDAQLQDLGRLAASLGLELELGMRGSRPPLLARYLDICRLLGVRVLRIILGDEEWTPPEAEAAAILRSCAPAFEQAGVLAAVENHFEYPPAALAEVIQQVNHPNVGVCLDPFNSISWLAHPDTTIDLLAPFAVSAHIKDASVTRQQTGFYIRGCPLGQGLLDIRSYLNRLSAYGRSPNVFIETWMDACETPAETLRQEEEWLRLSLDALRPPLNRCRLSTEYLELHKVHENLL